MSADVDSVITGKRVTVSFVAEYEQGEPFEMRARATYESVMLGLHPTGILVSDGRTVKFFPLHMVAEVTVNKEFGT